MDPKSIKLLIIVGILLLLFLIGTLTNDEGANDPYRDSDARTFREAFPDAKDEDIRKAAQEVYKFDEIQEQRRRDNNR